MVNIRSANEIILNLLDYFKTVQPDATLNPGSVIRDLFVEMPASQLSLLYDELSKISNLQSLRLVSGSDLDKLAKNFGATRKSSVKSSGTVIFTFSSIPATVSLVKGDLVYASNGATFAILNSITVNPNSLNAYRSLAAKYQADLDFLNISDQYAVEVAVQATAPGSSGNISKYSINKTFISGVSNVMNPLPFFGGSDQEDDATFRNRVLAIFSGSNIGTSLGYRNTALSDPSVLDALVIEPGDPLMTRDGTVVKKNNDGSYTILSEGQGGKVDIIILGNRISEYIDSFIYQDKSNNNDPADDKNDYTLGQIADDANKTINRKRIDNIANSVLPAQPVQEIVEVSGSLSGNNFVPKSVDSLGRVSGNYELIKDEGLYGGSPWGFDKFKWVSDRVSLYQEDKVKGKFAGQDNLTFTDVLAIPKIQQNILITNENSQVSSDRSVVQLLHTPATSITRVFNTNTGERYLITDQNPDGDGTLNTTGRIKISGNTLPSSSDILQVDYTWVVDYDRYSDYDGITFNDNLRSVEDSVDWGLSNQIRQEDVLFELNNDNTFYVGTVKHNINSVISTNLFNQIDGITTVVSSGTFTGRLAVNLYALNSELLNIDSIKLQNTDLEVYNTSEGDGVFFNDRVVVGAQIKYNITIILPTDTAATENTRLTVFYNTTDVFKVNNINGNFINNQITIPVSNFSSAISSYMIKVNYIANTQDALVCGIANMPLSRLGNGFITNSTVGFLNNFANNTLIKENQVIQQNAFNEFFITLNAKSTDYNITDKHIVSIIRLIDNVELWNANNKGTITTDTNNTYQIILGGLNSPAIGQNVLVLYYSDDLRRTQPFTFANSFIRGDIQLLDYDFSADKFFIPFYQFTAETSVSFDIIDPTTNLSILSGTDGYLVPLINDRQASFYAPTLILSSISDILGKKVNIKNSLYPFNNAMYDIISYDLTNNSIVIANNLENLDISQISVIRIADGKDLWTYSCSIDFNNYKLYLPKDTLASVGDRVYVLFFRSKPLRQAPSKLNLIVSDQINNSGILTVRGKTLNKVSDIVFTAVNNGLKQNVIEALKKYLGLSSVSSLSSYLSLVRITNLEKVSVSTNDEVLSVLNDYDLIGSKIKNNVYYSDEVLNDVSLNNFEFILPSTANNIANEPKIGDKFRITFYYILDNQYEDIQFTRNGSLYTNKNFAFIEKFYISGGFSSSLSTKFTLSYFNQPATGSRYKVFYDYLAPKQNERITIRYNYNRLIGDTTLTVESSRPINADVLVKSANALSIDLTMNIVIKADFLSSSTTVVQNVKDQITNAINTNVLGDTINSSDLISVAQSVAGVSRSRVIYFNKTGEVGQVLTITAQKNEYFSANNVIINIESV